RGRPNGKSQPATQASGTASHWSNASSDGSRRCAVISSAPARCPSAMVIGLRARGALLKSTPAIRGGSTGAALARGRVTPQRRAAGAGPSTTTRQPPPRNLLDRLHVAPGEAARCRLLPGKPLIGEMLARREGHRHRRGKLQREHVLGVVGDAGRVAVAPVLEDLVAVGEPEVG